MHGIYFEEDTFWYTVCTTCNGTGKVRRLSFTDESEEELCTRCYGEGMLNPSQFPVEERGWYEFTEYPF